MLVRIPGVCKIMGAFARCNRGVSVCTTDSRELIAEYNVRNDGITKACIVKTGECKKFTLSSSKIKKDDKWFNAIKSVYNTLLKRDINAVCLDINLDGDLLECEGHIVYSSIAVATVQALNNEMKLGFTKQDIADIAIDALVGIAENGNNSDIYTMLFCNKGQLLYHSGYTNKFEVFDNPFTGSDYSMVLVDGHIPIASLRDEVGSKEKQVALACKKFTDEFSIHDCIGLSLGSFKEMIMSLDEDTRRLCLFLFVEDKISYEMNNVLRNKDIATFGRFLSKIRETSLEDLEIVCPEMEWVVKRACEISGCIGASLFYEGFNTRVAVIMKNEAIRAFKENFEEYQRIFGFDITADILGDYKD